MSKRRGMLLALVMLMIPVTLLMVFSLTRIIFEETGLSMRAQGKARAFFLCQAALTRAMHVFECNNNRGHTHEPDGVTATSSSSPDMLDSYTMPELTRDSAGWLTWQCDADDLARSYTRSGQPESYRFQVFLPTAGTFCLRAEANVGGYLSRQEQTGTVTPLYDYVIFDNGNTNDFSRCEENLVEGKIHANGDIFFRPWTTPGMYVPPPPLPPIVTMIQRRDPAILNLKTDRITTAGKIIRPIDHNGVHEPARAYVNITRTDKNGPMVRLEGPTEGGGPYDSNHPNWRSSGPNGALAKFGGTVVDSELGAVKQNAPDRQTLTPGGYFDRKAGLRITTATSQSWCTDVSFYNQAESREVHVKEIDVAAMEAAGAFPSNGIIYAQTPVRLVNAHKLPGDMTLASMSTIYTKGDFNKDDPDGGGTGRSQSAALLTTDRVYNLTSSFNDANSFHYMDPIDAVLSGGPPEATDAPLYSGDDPELLEINAAITDGAPTVEARVWANEPDNPYYQPGNLMYFGADTGTKQVPDSQDPSHSGMKSTYPNPDEFLENMQKLKVVYRGSTVHMRNATMAPGYRNDECAAKPWLTPWIIKGNYIPPVTREVRVDPRLVDRPPPGAPQAARKLLWREL